MMRRFAVLCSGLLAALMATPVGAQTSTEGTDTAGSIYEVAFPDDWTVEHVTETPAHERFTVVLRAYPEDRSEECRMVDLGEVSVALAALDINDPRTLNYAAGELLGRPGGYATSGLGYSDPWSAYGEGPIGEGQPFALYNYVGRESWPGLEDAWLVLECWSDAGFHQDWESIARTFEYAIPQATLDSTGPVVIGGRIEVPSVDLALELPDGWVAVDLTHPDLEAGLEQMGREGDWFGIQLEHGVGEGIEKAAEEDEIIAIWAWDGDHGLAWPEHCTVSVKPPEWDSIAQRVGVITEYIAQEDRGELDASTLVSLPAGDASRFDFRWSDTSGGSDFVFLERGQQQTLACSDQALGDPGDVSAKHDRWLAMAESLQFLTPPSEVVAARR